MKILFCGYRLFAINVFNKLKSKYKNHNFIIAKNKNEFNLLINDSYDFILLVGWSWILPNNVVKKNICVGMHPSDLPNYAGGSPLQHQIINGVTQTKATLFKLSEKIDDGDIIFKEELSLEGNIDDIFNNLEIVSIKILCKFIDIFPNINYVKQKNIKKPLKRLKPKDSKLTIEKIKTMSCLDLYNFIRCRGKPYPNVYLEDNTGKIFFEKVYFINK